MRRSVRWFLALAAFLCAACGGSGGGGGPTTPTPPPDEEPPPVIEFTPDSAGAVSIALAEGSGTDDEVLFLSLDATGVTDLYGVAFDLRFPSNLLAFDNVTEGAFLDSMGGVSTSFQVLEDASGDLVIGLTRLGDVGGVDGSGSLLLFEFSRVASGSGSFEILNNAAVDSTGAMPDGVVWIAGTVTVPE